MALERAPRFGSVSPSNLSANVAKAIHPDRDMLAEIGPKRNHKTKAPLRELRDGNRLLRAIGADEQSRVPSSWIGSEGIENAERI